MDFLGEKMYSTLHPLKRHGGGDDTKDLIYGVKSEEEKIFKTASYSLICY